MKKNIISDNDSKYYNVGTNIMKTHNSGYRFLLPVIYSPFSFCYFYWLSMKDSLFNKNSKKKNKNISNIENITREDFFEIHMIIESERSV